MSFPFRSKRQPLEDASDYWLVEVRGLFLIMIVVIFVLTLTAVVIAKQGYWLPIVFIVPAAGAACFACGSECEKALRNHDRLRRKIRRSLTPDCIGENPIHGEIITRHDDPDIFDESVFQEQIPTDWLYGYCDKCRATFRWSVTLQQWVHYPGELAGLPLLTDEEMEDAYIAISVYRDAMPDVMFPSPREEVGRRGRILQSILTAIAEARPGTRQGVRAPDPSTRRKSR